MTDQKPPSAAQKESPATTKSTSPGLTTRSRRPRRRLGVIIVAMMILLLVLFIWSEQKRQQTADELEQARVELEQLRQSAQSDDSALAQQILEQVRQLIDLPDEPAPAVARIRDVETLRESNPFFNQAGNDHFLIFTANRAILFDPERNVIIDVAPFQASQATTSPAATPTGANEQSQGQALPTVAGTQTDESAP